MLRWDKLRVRFNSIGRVRCEPGWRLDPEWWRRLADYDIWFVWAGRGRFEAPGGAFTLRPGALLWLRPGERYMAAQDAGTRLGISVFHFDLLDMRGRVVRPAAALPPLAGDLLDVNYAEALTRRILELKRAADAERQAAATALLRGLLMDIDAAAAGSGAPGLPSATGRHHRDVVLRLAARISESPKDVPPLGALARECGYSTDHFSRVFKHVVGQAPRDFIVRARVDRARQLLAATDMPVGQIAGALGYPDVFFFSRQFKLKTGETPTQCRRARRASTGV